MWYHLNIMRPQLCLTLITLCLLLARPCAAAERIAHEWDFQKATDTLGWKAAEQVREFRVADGVLVTSPGPGQPKLESPLFELAAAPLQYIEIEMKTDVDGTGQVYYSDTTEEPYHGFRPGQYVTFATKGDGEFHTYRIHPFWQSLKKVIHIRIDPPGENVAIRAVRIIGPRTEKPAEADSWEFKSTLADWRAMDETCKIEPSPIGCEVKGNRLAAAISPLVKLDPERNHWVTVRLASKSQHTALFRWATDSSDGLHSVPIEVRGDGKMHSYSIDLGDVPEWAGQILAVGVTPSDTNDDRAVMLQSVRFGMAPVGPAELMISSFQLEEPFLRVGQTARLAVEARNTGGEDATSVVAVVMLPDESGTRMLPRKRIPVLRPGETAKFEWEITADKENVQLASCQVSGVDLDAGQKSIYLRFHPALDDAATKGLKYVPEPKPADTGEYMIGAYYFPGWHTYDRWAVLDDYPERKPVLGYYREGDPEIADWQIKWALEHGISYFIYDWYWSKGARQLEHALHDGLFKSRYQDRFKFCLLWANHNPPNTSSEQDLMEVTKYWIDNYFKRPNYLKIDGRNVMVIFTPQRLTDDMGSEAVKAAFDKMRRMCEEAGVGGLYMVACTYPGKEQVKRLEQEGYDALSGYNYPSAGAKGQQVAPYEWLIDGYKDFWTQIADAATTPYIPVCEPGWDSRPWHGHKAAVRTGKTPELWQKMLENAKAFVDDPNRKKPGGKKLVFLEAWNEYGEGDYIEPHAQYGFDYLEAVRTVFAPSSQQPRVLVPKDIGMGPYEINKPGPRTAWEFSKPEDRNWHAGNMTNLSYADGMMSAKAQDRDPALYSPQVKLDAASFKTIEIKMRMDKGEEAQVFFSRPRGEMTEERSIRFPVKGDGQFHVYEIDMATNPHWRGTIGQLRLDPNSAEGSKVDIEYMKLK